MAGWGGGVSRVEGRTAQFAIKRNSFEWVILHKAEETRGGGGTVAARAVRLHLITV